MGFRFYVNLLGVMLNCLGTLVVAFSVAKNPGGADQMWQGKRIPLASIFLTRFRVGIWILIVGYFCQILGYLESLLPKSIFK